MSYLLSLCWHIGKIVMLRIARYHVSLKAEKLLAACWNCAVEKAVEAGLFKILYCSKMMSVRITVPLQFIEVRDSEVSFEGWTARPN